MPEIHETHVMVWYAPETFWMCQNCDRCKCHRDLSLPCPAAEFATEETIKE